MASSNHRQRLIEVTSKLMQLKGFSGTGLNEIVRESGAPKGSMYHYFPGGKEELVAEAIRHSGAQLGEQLSSALTAESASAALMAAAETLGQILDSSQFAAGSPVATVALEMSGTSEVVRQACLEVYDVWHQAFRESLVRSGVPAEAAQMGATFALSAMEGALLLSRVRRSREPLEVTAALLAGLAAHLEQGGELL